MENIMIYKNNVDIHAGNPYKNDLFGREKSAKILTNLITSINKPLVLTIDSEWGSGKTTFVNMWKQDLDNQEFQTLYFNAWENDFVEEPFIAFINEFENIIKESQKLDEFKAKSKEIVRGLLPLGIKLLTRGVLDLDKINLGEELENGIVSYSEKLADENITAYKNTKSAMLEFKELLTNFVQENFEKTKKPIVFFVDELDRCRPSFAIKLLEKIKHLFNIEKLIFVIAVDNLQLGYSIKTIYGNEMNVKGYLARFIDLEYSLPKPNEKIYVKHLFYSLGLNKSLSNRSSEESDANTIEEACSVLFSAFNFSLRVQEKLISRFNIIVNTTHRAHYIHPELTLLLLSLKHYDVNIYDSLCNDEVNLDQFMHILDKIQDEHWKSFLEAYLIFALKENDKIAHIKKEIEEENCEEQTREKYSYILDMYRYLCRKYFRGFTMKYIYKKIEMSDDFVIN